MKNISKITFCGITAALSVIFMLLSYFPYFTYAAPAVTGLLIMMLVIEIDAKWALAAYIVSSILVFLFAEPESKLMYVCLFGYYPILKALIEQIGKPVIEWILKLIIFNIAVLVIYGVLSYLFNISIDDFSALGKYGAYIFLIIGNAVFVFYDYAISRMSVFYINRIHPKINRIIKF